MRIGVLTLHYGFNEGAILQAYALCTLLQAHFSGCTVEIIDHRYPAKVAAYGAPSDARKMALQNAIEHWLPLGPIRSRGDALAAVYAEMDRRYDAIVYGSDVIWELAYRWRFRRLIPGGLFASQLDPFRPAFPNIYWPRVGCSIRQFAFAASVGTLQYGDIPRGHRAEMRSRLQACNAISVRDANSLTLLNSLNLGRSPRVAVVADPTFSAAFRANLELGSSSPDVSSLLEKAGLDKRRPLAGFVCRTSDSTRAAAEWLRSRGWQIVGITASNDAVDVSLHDQALNPVQWVKVLGQLNLCVTERMHACIFSIMQNVPVIAIDMNRKAGLAVTKHQDLMMQFGLGEFCISPSASSDEMCRVVGRAVEREWEWSGIKMTVEALSARQQQFLDGWHC